MLIVSSEITKNMFSENQASVLELLHIHVIQDIWKLKYKTRKVVKWTQSDVPVKEMNFSISFVRLIVSLILIRPSVCINMQRNYRYFFLFVTSSALLCIFIFAMSALHLKYQIDYYGNVWKAIKESPASVILMAYCFFFLWFVGGLACFHLYLISTNQVSFAFIACTIFL